jgi:toxin ParE1/3/4
VSLRVRLTAQSRDDLSEIWDYIADDNITAADRTVDRLIAACQKFAHTPEVGRSREEFRHGLRSFAVGNHVIFYRIWPEQVDILRILHGARNIEELLTLKLDNLENDEPPEPQKET